MEGHRHDVLRTASARPTASCRGARPSRGPLLPPAPERRLRHPGRLHVPDRAALAGVMYVVRTGVTWRDVPAERVGCSGVTAWRQLRGLTKADVWPRLHATLLNELRRADLLDLKDCAVDGAQVRVLKPSTTDNQLKYEGREEGCDDPAQLRKTVVTRGNDGCAGVGHGSVFGSGN
ncbi:transposase [Streptomyces sp. NPDC055144]